MINVKFLSKLSHLLVDNDHFFGTIHDVPHTEGNSMGPPSVKRRDLHESVNGAIEFSRLACVGIR